LSLLQVDTDEVDRLSGRVRVNRSKFANRYGTTTTQKPAAQSTTASSAASARRENDATSAHHSADAEKLNEVQPQQQPTAQPAIPLPKQSGFVPRQRMFSYGGDRNTDASSGSGSNQAAATAVTASKASTAAKPEANPEEKAPAQTSFLQRKLNKEKQRQEEMKLKLNGIRPEREGGCCRQPATAKGQHIAAGQHRKSEKLEGAARIVESCRYDHPVSRSTVRRARHQRPNRW
jgi:hypothetical protein